jgi:hypothetical protein
MTRTICAGSAVKIAIILSIAASAGPPSIDYDGGVMSDSLAKRLIGTWRHSHEEDTETESIYRPDSFDFPPSRGRTGYTFRADHSCTYIGIAARDGSAKQTCTWEVREGASPEVVVTRPGRRQEVLRVVSVDRERLVVRKPRP